MSASSPFPIVLPSETRTREFDAKLLLAGLLAERGHDVYVGSRVAIHNRIHMLPRGLYLAKDVRHSSRRIFRILDQLGFAIAAWDEEALIFSDEKTYHERRVDPETVGRIKAFFAWGERDRKLIESAPGFPGVPVHVTGNPRFDLLSKRCRAFFEPEARKLRERFGQFILVNSNFGRINYYLRHERVRRDESGRIVNMGAGTPEFWDFRLAVYEAFRAMLPQLAAAFPDRQIVLRPHPSESHESWLEAAQGHDNVHVVHEGNVYPWIMASLVAIHNGCTTGLESYLLDHPVIMYRPVTHDRFDDQLPNLVSAEARAIEELIGMVRLTATGTPPPAPDGSIRKVVEAHIGPLDGVLAAERIDAIIAREGSGWLPAVPSAGERLAGTAHAVGRWAVKTINSFRPGHKNSRAYTRHRFPPLTTAEVEERLARLGRCLDRFGDLEVRRIAPDIFAIVCRSPTGN